MSNFTLLKFLFFSVLLCLFTPEGFALDIYTPQAAYQSKESDVQVRGTGTVVKVLRDDISGSRYQKFILKIPPGNRLESLSGDRNGEYSIRINQQYRICFKWNDVAPFGVEVTDYH